MSRAQYHYSLGMKVSDYLHFISLLCKTGHMVYCTYFSQHGLKSAVFSCIPHTLEDDTHLVIRRQNKEKKYFSRVTAKQGFTQQGQSLLFSITLAFGCLAKSYCQFSSGRKRAKTATTMMKTGLYPSPNADGRGKQQLLVPMLLF